jgi:hypothetical protein
LHAWKQLANIAQNRNNSRGIAFLLPYGTQTKEVPVANPDRDTVYTNDGTNRTIYSRESNSTGWFVGIIVALALLAIAYLVFSANSQPSTSTTVNNTPAVTTPAPADTTTTPMAPANDNTGTSATPMAPATTAPADNGTTAASSAAPTTSEAPASSAAAPASSAAPASDVAPSSAAAQ